MHGYGQICPIGKAAEVFCERWSALVIATLGAGAERFNDIQCGVPRMSATLLARRLRQLEAAGLVQRRRSTVFKTWTYHLTDAGVDVLPLIGALSDWARRWNRPGIESGDATLDLLIWGLQFTVDLSAFGPGRHVLRLDVTDMPAAKRTHWFTCENGRLDPWIAKSGREAGLRLATTLGTLIDLHSGRLSLRQAIERDLLGVDGAPDLVEHLQHWPDGEAVEPAPPAHRAPARAGAADMEREPA